MNKAFEKILEFMKWRLRNSEERYYKYLENSYLSCTFDKSDIEETRVDTIKEMLEIVQEVAEEYNGDWISCSKRLPEVATSYLVTEEVTVNSKKQYVTDIRLFGTEDEWLCPSNRKIMAWQPLPQPYKENENGKI